MIFHNFMNSFGLRSHLLKTLRFNFVDVKFLHEVQHNPQRSIFFVKVDNLDRKAVLFYKTNGKIMDLRGINVPSRFKGQGIARLLTETAFTYAIINDYYLYLTCSYAQKYYLANKNRELSKRIIGPKEVLDTSMLLDIESFEEIPDPEDIIQKPRVK